ncbi:MAG: hypothetical protein BGO29_07185 [Bacteroidales bacterium 36-12]|nr:MAG: hypothetical protein BGO29_07185 [Bacteroidales bacterium 36-12]
MRKKKIENSLVSVWVITYNQEKFISECLDSILKQETNFPFQIIIGEDNSTDKTRSICEMYANKYLNITLLPLRENLGLVKNWERTLNACAGRYVAMCEGDDFWIDSHKLQKQIDFLENNPDYSISFHRIKLFFEGGIVHNDLFDHLEEREYSAYEIYDKWTILTSSVVFRNFPKKIHFPKSVYFTDIYFSLYLLEKGRAYCHDFVGVAYRRHPESLSLTFPISRIQKLFYQYKYMIKRYPEFKDISRRNMNDWLKGLIYAPYFKGIWKFRLYKMYFEPKLIFTSFFTTTITSYIIKRKR